MKKLKAADAVLQFRVALSDIEPLIWRRFQIPASSSTFWSLHCAIQDAFGWLDYHLHEFRLPVGGSCTTIGIPDRDNPSRSETVLPSWDVPLAPNVPSRDFFYVYDFGDEWEHTISFEGRMPRRPRQRYPLCLDGARACPPEDSGGPHGYFDLLCAIKDPLHPQHRELLDWVGGAFDPERFSASAITFSNAKQRLRDAGLGAD